MEACKVERDMSLLTLVVCFLVLEPPLEFQSILTKLFGVIQNAFKCAKLANGRLGHAVVGTLARRHCKLKEIRIAWVIRNRFKVLLLLATNGFAIDIAKGIKGIHDDKYESRFGTLVYFNSSLLTNVLVGCS
jgi:hypothetical protein